QPSATIGGLVAVGVGLYTVLTIRDQLVEAAATQLSRAEVERALDSGLLGLTIGIGFYLVISGGGPGSWGGGLGSNAHWTAGYSGSRSGSACTWSSRGASRASWRRCWLSAPTSRPPRPG